MASRTDRKRPREEEKRSPRALSLPPPRRPLPPHQLVLAPMVGGSELAYRLLARKYGAQLTYTPMMYSGRLVTDEAYRKEELRTLSLIHI